MNFTTNCLRFIAAAALLWFVQLVELGALAIIIVDTQVHIWAANTPERPWGEGMENRAHLPVPLGQEDLLTQMDRAGVDCAILIPPSLDGDRNDLCLAAAQQHPERFAVMGRLLLGHPSAPARLAAMKHQRGMLGVRLTFHRDDDRPLLTNGAADWFWPAAERLQMPVMVHAPERLPEIAAIAARYPGLRIIIDHMGFARETMDEHAMAGARRVCELARYPNVSVKVSALPCYSTQSYPFRNLHDPLKRVIEAFGARRAFWGSDFSRLPRSCSYRQAVTMFTEELDFLVADELEWVMGRGVLHCLGWQPQTRQPR
ncbi:MAG TPA: amidohydrolase family protein [Micropepsaceae bacterium]|nr:amidohydrolase family protein [Micropepsaceae bacterium]